ncbi:MAG: transcriptional regulator [Myxococcales bacterium]|nr:transcriptional regulator [Myxococcales bacterium]
MPENDAGADWDSKFKGFLKKAGDDFKRAATDVKKEAERLMKEVKDPERQAKVREGVQEASVWAKKTAEQLASLVEVGVKQAEGALSEVSKQFKTAPGEPSSAPAPAPTPKNAAPPEMAQPPPSPKKPAKKTVGRGGAKKSPATKKTATKRPMGKKQKPVETPAVDEPDEG